MLFTIDYAHAHAHAASMDDICTELARGPWGIGGGWKVMTVRPNGITRNNEERCLGLRGDFCGIVPHDLQSPLADSPES